MRWLSILFRKQAVERQLDKELRFHLEQQVEDYIAAGMSPDEARRKARLDFGGLERIKEDCRDVRGLRRLEELAQDLRYGLRLLRQNPGFTAVAVLTLALGIGANTAIFSVVNGVLWHALPYENPGQLVQVFETAPQSGSTTYAALPNFIEWRNLSHSFDGMAAYRSSSLNLTGGEFPEKIRSMAVTADFFSMFRA
jgi:hypothetical protein